MAQGILYMSTWTHLIFISTKRLDSYSPSPLNDNPKIFPTSHIFLASVLEFFSRYNLFQLLIPELDMELLIVVAPGPAKSPSNLEVVHDCEPSKLC